MMQRKTKNILSDTLTTLQAIKGDRDMKERKKKRNIADILVCVVALLPVVRADERVGRSTDTSPEDVGEAILP